MNIRRSVVFGAAALLASATAVHAAACTGEIDRMQARLDAKVEALARAGRSAPEGSGALLHHQPTPSSIADAESRLGELSAATLEAIGAAMTRAREADQSGDRSACERALAEAQRLIGP
jgi:hypothetical protein